MGNDFLSRIKEVIEANLPNENFGVSELANEIGMSRSNLLRKIKASTKLSVSQLIREERLRHAMEMLKETDLTVSEISYKVGFSSTSYFIKCFHDHFGYPPGEAGKNELNEDDTQQIDDLTNSHQLAAIMFTDIQGYTALMQQDEVKAIEFRSRHREVFKAITKKFHGKILQYYGDGTLSTFSSAIDAVRCGIEMQLAYQREPQIPVRIGIHTGDIIVSKEDIIGDGVNVASRIESLASVGSVFISEKVYDEVKNQSGIYCTSMGVFELKNVDRPVEVFAITNPGLTIPDNVDAAGKLQEGQGNSKKGEVEQKKAGIQWILIVLVAFIVGYIIYTTNFFGLTNQTLDTAVGNKSIAVLPFINDSNDSSNVYIINGLMDATLNNLQKIKDLRVISRTSVEKYRINSKTSPEIARELNVKYVVEGSGQKIGDQILLNIQLIDALNDKHLWSEQYNRNSADIFALQMEVAKKIAFEISAIVTPEEEARIEKVPTDNLVAYDFFLKGYDLLLSAQRDSYEEAIPYFEKAIENDPEFARAYAAIAISYYYLDQFQVEKAYLDKINYYADKALFYDSEMAQSLIAKGLYYMSSKDYKLAESYLNKALEFNPNYDLVYVFLVELYVNYLPNTEKYLEYSLKGLELDIGSYDSATVSLMYLHISSAFAQSGFFEEAEQYINKSLSYDPQNLYSEYTKAYILYAQNKDLQKTKKLLLEAFSKDTKRLDIMQEIAKVYYFLREYDSAYFYYNSFIKYRKAYNLDIYKGENIKIACVFREMGQTTRADELINEYKASAEKDQSIYKPLSIAMYYAYIKENQKALDQLNKFTAAEEYSYWTLLLEIDPMVDNIRAEPEFKKAMKTLKDKFWERHQKLKVSLEKKGVL